MGAVAPHFSTDNFLHNNLPFGWKGIFAALPFAIWFYLAIEGVAMVAEEVKDPNEQFLKDIFMDCHFDISYVRRNDINWRNNRLAKIIRN